jgi:integrase
MLRYALGDRCPIGAEDISLRKIARELRQTAEPRRPVATQDRYEAIMKHLAESHSAYGYLRELLVLVSGTGHRLSEILSLQWADINFDAEPYGSIHWRADAVGNKARIDSTVEINPAVRAALKRIQQERPGIEGAWLFPRTRRPKGKREKADAKPIHRSVADKWLRMAEKGAKLQPQPGSLWHAYRRKWATEKKHLPAADVAAAGGWKNARTLQNVYQQSDPAGVLRVVLDQSELREERV